MTPGADPQLFGDLRIAQSLTGERQRVLKLRLRSGEALSRLLAGCRAGSTQCQPQSAYLSWRAEHGEKLDGTNNATEQIIDNSIKECYRTTRSCMREESICYVSSLIGWVCMKAADYELGEVVANLKTIKRCSAAKLRHQTLNCHNLRTRRLRVVDQNQQED